MDLKPFPVITIILFTFFLITFILEWKFLYNSNSGLLTWYIILIFLKLILKSIEKASVSTTFLLLIFYSFGHLKGMQIEEILNNEQKYKYKIS